MSLETIELDFIQHLANDADISLSLGMENNLGELGDPGMQAHHQSISNAKALLERISKEDTVENFYQRLDLHLIQLYLKRELFFKELSFNGKLQRQQKPGGIDGISAGIFQLFINDPREPDKRLDNILSRLYSASDYLTEELKTLDTPVRRWRDIEVMQGEGLADLFATILNWAKVCNYPDLKALDAAIIHANKAIRQYIDALKSMPTTSKFAIEEVKVKELLALGEINQSPEQLRAMAENYLLSTEVFIEDLRLKLIKKYQLSQDTDAATLQDFLSKQHRVTLVDGELDSILDVYQREKSKLIGFLAQKELFPIPEQQDLRIIRTPGFLEPVIPAGAMWPPIALRKGDKTSIVYLTLKEDQINEHTHLGIPVMMLHEGIPGHHLQFASASLQPSFIRKIFRAGEHAEGWTTMLEDYLLDSGYIENELVDEVRFIAKREISRLAARVGIDLYFMTGDKQYLNVGLQLDFDSDDPFENAAKLLKAATGFTDGRVQAELNWYSTERGIPLCYLTGNQMVWKLKRDIQNANLKQLSADALDKEFHRIYLNSGCMPVSSLREVFRYEGLLPHD